MTSGKPDSTRRMLDEASRHTGNSQAGMTMSMHKDVEVWCDCCSCEAEPYWVEAMQNEASDSKNKNKS
jgi:hypothetical protein